MNMHLTVWASNAEALLFGGGVELMLVVGIVDLLCLTAKLHLKISIFILNDIQIATVKFIREKHRDNWKSMLPFLCCHVLYLKRS